MNTATSDTIEVASPSQEPKPYSIKRHGTSLSSCESEPVHSPGCIQAHGALLVVRLCDFTILQASENCAAHFGAGPAALFGQSVKSLIGIDNQVRLHQMTDDNAIERNVMFAFTLFAQGELPPLDVCAHTVDGLLVLEFEPVDHSPGRPDAASKDYFPLVRTAVSRLHNAVGLQEFSHRIATEVRDITGLDRVIIYRFHPDQHGEVIAESKADGLASFLGLHYPEADIPRQARELYKRLWIRPVPDVSGQLAELVPLANPDTGQPLDMTHCLLRGVSVMYSEYLENMGVAATLTMPLRINGELWGMIAGHHTVPICFPHQLRSACELLAQVASLQLKSVEQVEQLAYQIRIENTHQRLVARAAQEGDLLALSDNEPSLLDAMDAAGAALLHMHRWRCAGRTPNTTQLDALAAWLFQRKEFESGARPVYATDMLSRDYPGGHEMIEFASGLIAVQISRLHSDLIIWFRPETIQTVQWAGNPQDKPMIPGPNGMRLTPRRSFELFVESVRARSLPWTAMEVDAALRLRMLIMELVTLAIERLAKLNGELVASNEELDAFAFVASHDLKEPLRGIHRYAHQIMESGELKNPENGQRLDSLMRLTLRMDKLLDSLLHYSRVGRTHLDLASVNLNQVVAEAIEMVGIRSNDNSCSIVIARPLPMVECDLIRAREIFSNLISNAQKYNRHQQPRIEIGYLTSEESRHLTSAPLMAKDQTIYFVRDDGIGIAPEHVAQIFRMFKRLHGREEFGGGVGAGLCVVKKVVSRHGGCVWFDSTPAVGSTFYFTLSSASGTTG